MDQAGTATAAVGAPEIIPRCPVQPDPHLFSIICNYALGALFSFITGILIR